MAVREELARRLWDPILNAAEEPIDNPKRDKIIAHYTRAYHLLLFYMENSVSEV